MRNKRPEWLGAFQVAFGAGFTLLGSILTGLFIGSKVGEFFGFWHAGIFIGAFTGCGMGLYVMYRRLTK